MNKEIIESETTELVAIPEQPLFERLLVAAQNGLDLDKIERFMDLAERNEQNEARRAFNRAFAGFKANPPKIVKDQFVKFGKTEYKHASIGNVVSSIISGMAKHGLSHSWGVVQDGGNITVSCKITHGQGYSESVSMTAPSDNSGGKNTIQAIASTITYLERYTLQAATGIAVLEQDNDGADYGKKQHGEESPGSEERQTPQPDQKLTSGDWEVKFESADLKSVDDIKQWRKDHGDEIRETILNDTEARKFRGFLDDNQKDFAEPPEGIECPETALIVTEEDCKNASCSSIFEKCSGSKMEINI